MFCSERAEKWNLTLLCVTIPASKMFISGNLVQPFTNTVESAQWSSTCSTRYNELILLCINVVDQGIFEITPLKGCLKRRNLQAHYLPSVGEEKFSSVKASKAHSAASIPDFIAVCVPLIFGTFINPGLQPTRRPPGKANLGMHWTKITYVPQLEIIPTNIRTYYSNLQILTSTNILVIGFQE